MKPEQKAQELINIFGKDFSLIVVDEIVKECNNWTGGGTTYFEYKRFKYWQDVILEIKKHDK